MCLPPVPEAKPLYSWDRAESGVWSLNPRDKASVPAQCTQTPGIGLCEQPVHNSESYYCGLSKTYAAAEV